MIDSCQYRAVYIFFFYYPLTAGHLPLSFLHNQAQIVVDFKVECY